MANTYCVARTQKESGKKICITIFSFIFWNNISATWACSFVCFFILSYQQVRQMVVLSLRNESWRSEIRGDKINTHEGLWVWISWCRTMWSCLVSLETLHSIFTMNPWMNLQSKIIFQHALLWRNASREQQVGVTWWAAECPGSQRRPSTLTHRDPRTSKRIKIWKTIMWFLLVLLRRYSYSFKTLVMLQISVILTLSGPTY